MSKSATTATSSPTQPASACCADSCCGGARPAQSNAAPASPPAPNADSVREKVREGYSTIAVGGCCGPSGATGAKQGGGCCGATAFTPEQLVKAIGYTDAELAATPDSANMGLSCGNPTALASLKPGEVVLDLGAGGGFDCFVAGPKVGPTGKVIGVDMTPAMLASARKALPTYTQTTGLSNVEFRLGEIEHLPVPDASVDVVISNCVLNLSPDKPQVWREIARVLKPGGRVAVSDLALLRPLPREVEQSVEALVGCVAGAVLAEDSRRMALDAGLTSVELGSKPEYIDAMTNWEDPLYREIVAALPPGARVSEYITSLNITASKVTG